LLLRAVIENVVGDNIRVYRHRTSHRAAVGPGEHLLYRHGKKKVRAKAAIGFRDIYRQQPLFAEFVPQLARENLIVFPLIVVRDHFGLYEAFDICLKQFQFFVHGKYSSKKAEAS